MNINTYHEITNDFTSISNYNRVKYKFIIFLNFFLRIIRFKFKNCKNILSTGTLINISNKINFR